MKKTFTKRFFPSLLLMLVGCLWGNSAWAEAGTVTYTVSSTTAVTTRGTAPSGSSATYSSTYSTKSQLTASNNMTLTLSGYAGQKITGITLSMRSNKSSGAGYLDVKAGETQLATIGSPSSGVNFNKGAWYGSWSTSYVDVNVTLANASYAIQDGEDVVIVIGATVNSLYCQSFTLTYEEDTSAPLPTITTSETSLSFGDVETGTSKQQTFTLSGKNLTADATLSITGDNAEYFNVNPTGVFQTDGTIANTNVTVTYAPTATGPHTATLTIASGETTKEIALSGTGIAPLAHYTVNWKVNGTAYTEGMPTTDVTDGSKVTALPTTPPAIGDKVFMGWTDAEISGTLAAAPSVLFATAEDAPAVTGNVTYYAVYATEAMGSSAWKRIKTLADITDGSYVIKNDDYILPNADSNKAPSVVAAPAISDETITGEVKASMIWSFTSTGTANQFYVQNADGSYLYEISNNDGIRVGSTSDKWTFAVNTTDYFSMKGATNSRYCATYNNQDWRSYTSATHTNYANGGKLELYKLTIEKSYSDYATTVVGKVLEERNLSFGETTAFDAYGTTFSAPELTGATSGVTYTSSNEAVATVDANTGAVTITGTTFGTTTIKAAADKDEDYLADEATYTLSVWPASIAGIKLLINSTTATDFKAKLTNATITYVSGNNVYLQDDNAAILMYLPGHALTAGKSYTGGVTGTGMLYNGLREITAIDLSGITPTDNTKEPETVTLAQLSANFDAYESKYVKVEGVTTGTFTTSGNYQTTTLTQGTDKLQLRAPRALTLIANNDYDFVGFPGIYNGTQQLNIWEESQAINQGKLSANLAFEQAVYNMEVDGSVTVKATNASGATIVYSVADETHCLVNPETGYFTADAAGTYTVTATCEATGSYTSGIATCQVVVTAPVSNLKPTVLYKQITSEEEIVDGGVYLIVCESKGDAMGALDTSNKRVSSSNDITIKDDKGFNYYDGEVNATGYPYEITITKAADGTYNLYHAEGKYINGNANSDLSFTDDTYAGWSISFVESTGSVRISHKNYKDAYIQRNTTDRNQYYKNYKGSLAVQLYQKVSEMNVHAKVNGYTTFVADFAYVMPTALTGKTVSVAADGSMSIDDAFQGGEEVPALTPLLVRTSESYAAEETKKTYYPVITTKTVSVTEEVQDLIDANNLEYYRTAEGMTSSKKPGTPCYYKLSVDTEGNNPGFYWGAAEGAAFVMKNGSTAYLACAPISKVSKFVIDENGTTTAIEGVTAEDGTNGESVVYNLQGIRVNPKNLQKGIYIINGRKTVVK